MPVKFDDASHTYHYDNQLIPSVTQVIKLAGLMPSAYYNDERAMQRGRFVADATQFDDEDDLDMEELSELLVPYVYAWRNFKKDTQCHIVAIEEIVFNETYMYAGRVDRRILLDGKEGILDIKTGYRAPWHALQTAGYSACYTIPQNRFSLYLREDGTYRLERHDESEDLYVFLSALTIVNWKTLRNIP